MSDNPPAFPHVINEDWKQVCLGMTLRDYFAAAALPGVLGSPAGNVSSCETVAKWSYDMADAMLAQRNKQ